MTNKERIDRWVVLASAIPREEQHLRYIDTMIAEGLYLDDNHLYEMRGQARRKLVRLNDEAGKLKRELTGSGLIDRDATLTDAGFALALEPVGIITRL